ncbi:conserved hypothetical protein [Gammaproteobacteria bacterium]
MVKKVLLGAVVITVCIVFLQPKREIENELLPWNVQIIEGFTRVFGITLARSPFSELERKLHFDGEIGLFVSAGEKKTLEGYFRDISLAGLTASIIAEIHVPEDHLEALYNRGARLEKLPERTKRISLSSEDFAWVRNQPIINITYLPKIFLQPTQIESRFGKPEKIIQERDSMHWLYPKIGLDVVIQKETSPIFQYVPLDKFENLVRFLKPTEN